MALSRTDSQPAPTPLDLPGDGDWHAWVSQRCHDQLEEAQQQVGLVKAGSSDAPVVLVAWNKAETAIANAASAPGQRKRFGMASPRGSPLLDSLLYARTAARGSS